MIEHLTMPLNAPCWLVDNHAHMEAQSPCHARVVVKLGEEAPMRRGLADFAPVSGAVTDL